MIAQSSFLGIPLRTRFQRRALVVGYYSLVAVFPAIALFRSHGDLTLLLPQTLTWGSLLGGIRAGGPVKSFEGDMIPGTDLSATTPNYPIQSLNLSGRIQPGVFFALDEREQAQRDHAHYRAYAILRWVLGVFGLIFLVLSHRIPSLLSAAPVLLWTLVILTLSLPQCVILWTELDQPDSGELTLVHSR